MSLTEFGAIMDALMREHGIADAVELAQLTADAGYEPPNPTELLDYMYGTTSPWSSLPYLRGAIDAGVLPLTDEEAEQLVAALTAQLRSDVE